MERVRRVPGHFSWVDHRLVRDGFCRRCRPEEYALYLLLLVGDTEGLSYYADQSVARLINLPLASLAAAQAGLLSAELIAYRAPIYQVLELPEGRA